MISHLRVIIDEHRWVYGVATSNRSLFWDERTFRLIAYRNSYSEHAIVISRWD